MTACQIGQPILWVLASRTPTCLVEQIQALASSPFHHSTWLESGLLVNRPTTHLWSWSVMLHSLLLTALASLVMTSQITSGLPFGQTIITSTMAMKMQLHFQWMSIQITFGLEALTDSNCSTLRLETRCMTSKSQVAYLPETATHLT